MFLLSSSSNLVPGELVLLGDGLSRLIEPVLGISGTATANHSLVLVKGALSGHLGCVRVNSGLAGAAANTLKTTLACGPFTAVLVDLLGGLTLDGLTEAGVDIGRGGTTEGVRGRGLVVCGLSRGLLSVAGV